MKNAGMWLVAAIILIAAIGYVVSRGSTSGQSPQPTTTPGGYTTNLTTAPTTVASTKPQVVNFTEAEYSIVPATLSLKASTKVVFVIKNVGKVNHNLVVVGNNYSTSLSTPPIAPGANLTVNYTTPATGQWSYYSNIPGQRQLGMYGTLTTT